MPSAGCESPCRDLGGLTRVMAGAQSSQHALHNPSVNRPGRCDQRPGVWAGRENRSRRRPHNPSAFRRGGYEWAERVFFTGADETFQSGDKLVHGQLGEVVGPCTVKGEEQRRVSVRFPGNKSNIDCFLYQLRRETPAEKAAAERTG